MSSKSGDPAAGDGNAPQSPRSWSLTVRLALLTALSSCLILALVSTQMYFQLAGNLEKQNIGYLMDEVETLAQMARFPEFRETLAMEMHVDAVGEEYLTHYVRLLDRGGARIIETPDMQKRLPQALFPPAVTPGRPAPAVAVKGDNGSSFIVTSLMLGTGEFKGMTLQVGLDVTNVEKILAGYRIRLAAALAIGFLLSIGAGLVVARRGTRPVREITERAREITVARLDERLRGADWPREVASLADALNGMLDRLQDSFSRLYNSVANLTHKLRTPLTILRGEAEVALSRERSAEELCSIIESSMEEYGRLSRLIDNIVFIAQAEAGKLKCGMVKIKARTEIDKVLDFYGPLAEEKGITVTCEGDAELTADPDLLRKAVTNLLSNAVTYTDPGGTARISIRQTGTGSAEISITDSGRGISEQEMPKIFDRFYRVYDTRFMDPHGSGLGLSLVRTIMNLHNGTVELRSHPGQGTVAILTFPPPAV